MYFNKNTLAFIVCFFCINVLKAQDEKPKKVTLNGYITNLQSVISIDSLKGNWIYSGLVHNRLNFFYYPSSNWTFSAQMRNRFIYGDQVQTDINHVYRNQLNKDAGFFDLSFNPASGRSFIFNTTFDRLYIKYTLSKLELTIGRQRINWGQTWVWNCNDWFNTYSFFDFDYEERPGSDAVRLQYYTGMTSSLEVAAKLDSSKKLTAAGLYKFNKWNYDFQFLGGILSGKDVALGMGWAGEIGSIGFRGEMSYFHPAKNFSDTSGLFLLSVAFDYTFKNSLSLQFEGFYNQLPGKSGIQNFNEFYQGTLNVKSLSFTDLNFFGQVSYPITPLLNAALAAMVFPRVKGYYLGPSLTYSLANNLDFTLYVQLFSGEFPDLSGVNRRQSFDLGFMRFKYSF